MINLTITSIAPFKNKMLNINFSYRINWNVFSLILGVFIIASLNSTKQPNLVDSPPVPVPLYPQNGNNTTPDTDPPLGLPTFSWSSIEGATRYHLQVDNDDDFSSPIIGITTPNTSYTPELINHLFPDDILLYWRVRTDNPMSDWSEPINFTKTWATLDNKPVLLSPPDNGSLSFYKFPDFSWGRVGGAAKYRFQIASAIDSFATPLYSIETLTPSHQPDIRLANGVYWWRVVPVDAADHNGTPSVARSFNLIYGTGQMTPDLIEPADGSILVFTPTFRWSAIEGAEFYRLEYTSANLCDFSSAVSLTTRHTSYTPIETFLNDQWYCWRVRVESGPSIGDWSAIKKFQVQWHLQPELLTPTNHDPTGSYPMFSWTPVPGAAQYEIEISKSSDFTTIYESAATGNTTYTPRLQYSGNDIFYWRVMPIDGSGRPGSASLIWDYQIFDIFRAPQLVYPQYYYLPNHYDQSTMNPYEDRTVPYPVFMWQRVMKPAEKEEDGGGIYGKAYRIQVDDDPPEFTIPVWQYDTENTSAAPTGIEDDVFAPTSGEDYWWRVCPLDALGGSCLTNPNTGDPWWSQIWRARFDPSLSLQPTTEVDPLELLRPVNGQETVEATPMFEWKSVANAILYQIEVARDPLFATDEISQTVTIPVYTPDESLAQRLYDRIDYGTYYWRVRSFVSGSWNAWSETRHFQIASQSEWRYGRSPGNPDNLLLIGVDPISDVITSTFDLTTLFASQANLDWYLGFNTNLTTTDVTYVIYIDLDHLDGSGSPTPPISRNYHVTTVPAHQPEYAVYVDSIDGLIDAQHTWVDQWNAITSEWDIARQFSSISGDVYTSTGYVELRIPASVIGMDDGTHSISVMLFSVDPTSGTVKDTVPTDPQVPGSAHLSRFSAVSDRMNLIYPPVASYGDATKISTMLPFYWDWPTGSYPSTPYAGSILEIALDPEFSSMVANIELTSPSSYTGNNKATVINDLLGDHTYYWRMRPRYKLPGFSQALGAWSDIWNFSRHGFTPQNLQASITSSMPILSWEMVEGANSYRVQISTDQDFDPFLIDQVTRLNSYTPTNIFPPGTYYWHVQANRYDTPGTSWSQVKQFNITYPSPNRLIPDHAIVPYTPTLCWDPLLIAWKYHLQVSRDPAYSVIDDDIDTINPCWTSTAGYEDNEIYWRVAMVDEYDEQGSYSPSATFTHRYPTPSLVSPIHSSVQTTPTFAWTPVDGAATYRIEVAMNPNFFTLFDSATTISTQFTPTKTYANNKIYYWRVAMIDINGNKGSFTNGSFTLGELNYIFPLVYK